MRKFIIGLIASLFVTISATAQNKIDELVDRYSTVGSSNYTSVVKRDPKTQRVTYVVKVLTATKPSRTEMTKAFEEEAKNGSLHKTTNNEKTTLILTIETPTANRVYMFESPNHPGHVTSKTTIITNIKE